MEHRQNKKSRNTHQLNFTLFMMFSVISGGSHTDHTLMWMLVFQGETSWLTAVTVSRLVEQCMGGTLRPGLHVNYSTESGSKLRSCGKMVAFVSWIFRLHFWIVGGTGEVSSIFTETVWLWQQAKRQKYYNKCWKATTCWIFVIQARVCHTCKHIFKYVL